MGINKALEIEFGIVKAYLVDILRAQKLIETKTSDDM